MAKEKDWKLVASRERFLNKEYVPSKLLQHLYELLTDGNKEEIVADEKNHGPIHASSTLLNYLRRRGEMAFALFVTALRSAGYYHAAQLLDPHYDVRKSGIEAGEDEGVAVAGVVADIRIEVALTSSKGERVFDKEKSISGIYSESKMDETIKLRDHFMESLCQEILSWTPVFVKTTLTKTNPPALVLIFRLSDIKAAEKLWDAFESGKLKLMIEKGLKSSEQIKDEEIAVKIHRECYDKVLRTLDGSEHSVLIDGEEKKDLVLRESQVEPAQSMNTIICAPTGFGKTFVAMAVIKRHLPSPSRKKVVFIVNTVSLVHQQQQRLDIYLPEGVRVAGICGNNSDVPLSDVLESNDVVVLTAQILVDALKKGDTISDFSLLVFDECHHTKGNHAYNNIMRFYTKEKLERKAPNLPQILGLSASLGIGTKNLGSEEKARTHMLEICANLDADTLQVAESNQQATDTKLILISRKEISDFKNVINEVMEEIEGRLKGSKLDGTHGSVSCQRGSQPYENWVVALCKEDLGRDFMTCAEHLRAYNNALMISEDLRTKDALDYLHGNIRSKGETKVELLLNQLYDNARAKILLRQSDEGHETNAWLCKLEELLLEKFTDNYNNNSRVIVFVRTRFAAIALEDWMKNSTSLKQVVKPTHVIGCGQRNGSEGMTKVQQDVEINKFRNGNDCNLIIGTSMLLEGIDIPDCDFVINYGMPGNEITHVQARGRVRTKGVFVVIMDDDKCRMLKEQDLEKEKLMKEVILKIASMTSDEFKKEVNRLQKDAYEEDIQRVAKESKLQKKTLVNGMNFHCMKCGEFACEVRHVKVFHEVHHLVPNHAKTLKSLKFTETEEKNVRIGLTKIGEIVCGKCDLPWGVMMRNQHGQFPCVKINKFRVKGGGGGAAEDQVFKHWKDFPYEIQRFDSSELENTENGESDSV